MLFKHKRDTKNKRTKEQKKSPSKLSGDRSRKKPAILVHGAEERHQTAKQGSKGHKPQSQSKDKEKVSLFQKSHQKKEENRRTDELIANLKAKRFNHKVIDLLGYKGLTNDKNHFIKLSGSVIDGNSAEVRRAKYAEILKIGGTGIDSLPENMIQRLLSDYVSFWRSYLDDVTCICLPLPTDSKDQQHDWQNQIDKENDQLLENHTSSRVRQQMIARKALMQENLSTLQNVDRYLVNQGFALLVFAQTKRELADNVSSVTRLSQYSLNLSRLSVSDKEDILKRINNPAMMLNAQGNDDL